MECALVSVVSIPLTNIGCSQSSRRILVQRVPHSISPAERHNNISDPKSGGDFKFQKFDFRPSVCKRVGDARIVSLQISRVCSIKC